MIKKEVLEPALIMVEMHFILYDKYVTDNPKLAQLQIEKIRSILKGLSQCTV